MSGDFEPNATYTITPKVVAGVTQNAAGAAGRCYLGIQKIKITTNANGQVSNIVLPGYYSVIGGSIPSPATSYNRFEAFIDGVSITSPTPAVNPNPIQISGSLTQCNFAMDVTTGLPVPTATSATSAQYTLIGDLATPISNTFTLRITGTSNNTYEGAASINATFRIGSPSVDADFVLVNSFDQPCFVLLPKASNVPPGRLMYIKDRGTNAQNNRISVIPYGSDTIDGQPFFNINDFRGCLTLTSDGTPTTNWRIVNYYPSPNQLPVTEVNPSTCPTEAQRIGTATKNAINIFNTNANNFRQGGNNLVNLPNQGGTPSICVIVYSGTATNNTLYFDHPGNSIDATYFRGTGYVMATLAGVANKSLGVVFIGNGTIWFIAGWYNPATWTWLDVATAYPGQSNPYGGGITNINTNLDTRSLGRIGNNAFHYTLPTIPIEDPGYFLIEKAIYASGNSGINGNKFSTFSNTSGVLTNNFNKGTTNNTIYYNNAHINSAIWFVSQYNHGSLTSPDARSIWRATYLTIGSISFSCYSGVSDPDLFTSQLLVGDIVTTNMPSIVHGGLFTFTNGIITSIGPSTYSSTANANISLVSVNVPGLTTAATSQQISGNTPGYSFSVAASMSYYPVIGYTPGV